MTRSEPLVTPLTLTDLSSMRVDVLNGVGQTKRKGLEALGVTTLLDLLTHFPRRYVDRTHQRRVSELTDGEEAVVLVSLRSVSTRRARSGRMMVICEFTDGTGSIRCTFFNQPWRQKQLEEHGSNEVALFGKIELFNRRAQMTNPVVDLIGTQTGMIVPIYPLSEKARITTWELGGWVAETLRRSQRRGILDPLPAEVLDANGLISRSDAFTGIHFPKTMAGMVAARTRLVFDELLRIQLSLVTRKRELESSERGVSHLPTDSVLRGNLVRKLLDDLPFDLTRAQTQAIAQIDGDLRAPVPMHRLLQGDVGAGKTLVALAGLLSAVQAGHQGAFMAPTEVLAEQHGSSLGLLVADLEIEDDSLLGRRPVRVGLLTSRVRAADRRRILGDLADGRIDVMVGTHALLEESVRFRSLGMVVIDEQHRFGVEQRAALRNSDGNELVPDVLVMTATPIPRTAAMTVYGDLDVTVLDELPPGRTPIRTHWAKTSAEIADAWKTVRAEVSSGRQAYVVCPLVSDSERIEAASATETFEKLSAEELDGLELGLLHGRVPPETKEEVMARFRDGRIDVLVATTVIEVGVDVPNATVMVVLDADRFGLAQLHQLRGRVGRGSERSHCFLVTNEEVSGDGDARLTAMVGTTDGFELAEIDLDLRGSGTIMGQRQKGRTDLKLVSLRRDEKWISRARDLAFELTEPGRDSTVVAAIQAEVEVMIDEGSEEFLDKS